MLAVTFSPIGKRNDHNNALTLTILFDREGEGCFDPPPPDDPPRAPMYSTVPVPAIPPCKVVRGSAGRRRAPRLLPLPVSNVEHP